MKKISLFAACLLAATFVQAQNYNPFVAQGIISPAPLLPVEYNGTGVASFKVGNTGSDPLVWNSLIPNNDMILTISLSRGLPNVTPVDATTALTAIGGSYASKFNWTYDVALNTYTGRQNQTIPGLDLFGFTNEGLVTIQYKVTQNSPQSGPQNGFNVNLTPPPYTNFINSLSDDAVSSYTWTEIRDFGDAPIIYASADHVIDTDNYMYLGTSIDGELANQASATANGDDAAGIDDEDGVVFPVVMNAGTTVNIPVTVVGGGWLNAWIDWNGDGDFADAGEKIRNNLIMGDETRILSVAIPADANTSAPTFARFRFGPSGTGSSGSALYGEVEDYQIAFNCAPPAAPVLGLVTQPTCLVATGSVELTGLPAGTWTINPGAISGTGLTTTLTGLSSGLYTFTVTNSLGCVSAPSAGVTIDPQPAIPAVPVIGTITQPTCLVANGSVVLSGLPAGTWTINPGAISGTGSSTIVTPLSTGTYNFTITNSAGCTSAATANVVIDPQPLIPSAPVIGTITQPTCLLSTGSVVLNGLPAGTWTINPGAVSGSGASTTLTGLATGLHSFTVTNAAGCTSAASAAVNILTAPVTPTAPVIGTITQPTCTVSTGSVILSGLPSGTWTINPGAISGTGASTSITGLVAGTYAYTVTNADGCISPVSANVIIDAQPVTPPAPVIGTITQPTCTVATGSVLLTGLPAGTWTINPGAVSGTGSSTTVSGLIPGTHAFTVTNASGCTSVASANVVINPAPGSPLAPVIGTITQPTCILATGSVVLSGLPTGNWTINPGAIAGTGATTTVSGLPAGTHNFTVTNADGCVSPPSANVVINAQPATPVAPVIGTITQPTCTVATGSVVLSGLPTGNWQLTVNPGGSTVSGTGSAYTVSGLSAGTYNYTVTNAAGCTSAASGNIVINAQPATPVAPVIGTITQPTCSVATGSVVLTGLPSGTWTINPGAITGSTATATVNGLAAGTYNFTVTNSAGCTSVASANVVINAQPATPPAPVIGTITQPTCSVATGSVPLSGLPAGNWQLTINPGGSTISTAGSTYTLTGLTPGTYTFTVTNAAGCTSVASGNAVINAQPATPASPVIGTITQPTCTVATGSVPLTGLPAAGTWTLTRNPGSVTTTGTGTTSTISGLAAGTYTFTVTNAAGCTSAISANAVINTAPGSPLAPVIGTITQPTCLLATGSVVLTGLPAGSWTINPGAITGSTATATISGLVAGTYSYTVTNSSGCVSPPSANVVINAQPATPVAPVIGTITQPSCSVATGSVVLTGLPSGSWTINPGAIAGSTSTATISGLTAGTYSYTVTNAAGCVSAASANVVINAQPATPAAPAIGTITQPTCTVATGSVVLTGLPSGSWTINPGAIAGSTSTATISGLTAGTYSYTVTNAAGCVSVASGNVVINAQPATPAAPVIGPITQPTCSVATGSVVLTGLPSGNWTINPGAITGSTSTATISGLTAGTYTYTVTNAAGCVSVASGNVVINAQPATPVAPAIGTITQPTCSVATGSVVLTGLPSGNWTINPGAITGSTPTRTISGLTAGTYTYTVTNAAGCVSVASANVVINAQPATPVAPVIGTITQPTCALATGSVVITGLPAGSWIINPGAIAGSTTTATVSGLSAGTYNFTVTNAAGCVSAASANVVINAQPATPAAPVIGTITQPTCFLATGSVVLGGLPAGSWTINPGAITGSTSTVTVSGLTAGNYAFTVTNSTGCISLASGSAVINTAPGSPVAPVIGTITQPTCTLATGSVLLTGLPAGTWTINPGAITGSTSTTTLSGLLAGTYAYTVTNSAGCVSPASANVVISAQPASPVAPAIGTITQPTCTVATGSVVLGGLPAGNWQLTINPGGSTVSGTGIAYTLSGLIPGTHNITVTNAAGCTSLASANVVINAQPATPVAPAIGTITQPTCSVATGTVVLTGLPSGNWTINPGAITGSTSTATVSGLAAGTYSYTVTNAAGCTSLASANVVINQQPATPAAPVIGNITQPNCTVTTGSVVVSGLPTGNWQLKINPGGSTVSGTGPSYTVQGLSVGSYTFTVTNAAGCVSTASAAVVMVVSPCADLSITKVGTPDPVVAGQPITYTLTVRNTGPADAPGVVVTDAVPSTVQNAQYSLDGGTNWNTWAGQYAYGTLASGSQFAFLIRGTVSSTSISGSILSNTASVTGTLPDGNLANNTATDYALVNTVLADLGITKVGNPDPIQAGQVITYKITYSNFGPSSAPDVLITDAVPASVLNPEFSIDNGLTWNPWVNPYAYGLLNAGCDVDLLLRGTMASNLASGTTVVNTATITATVTDPNTSNNTATDVATITGCPLAPVIGAITQPTCTTPTGSVVLGGLPTGTWIINPGARTGSGSQFTVTGLAPGSHVFTVTNSTGCASPASAAVVINAAPGVPAAPSIGVITQPTCSVPTGSVVLTGLPSGTWTINPGAITGSTPSVVISGLATGTYNYSVTNAAGCTSLLSANIVIYENLCADLSIAKVSSPRPVIAGQVITYAITVSSWGQTRAQNVTVADAVPAAVLNPEFSTNGGLSWAPWTSPYNFGTLAAYQSFSFLIRGTVNPGLAQGSLLSNTAVVSSTSADPNPGNNSATDVNSVTTSADLSIVKTGAPKPVVAGQLMTYTIAVNNAGYSNALAVTVTDEVPATILNPEFSTNGGTTWAPWTRLRNFGTLNANSGFTFQIRGMVKPDLATGANITNLATVSSTTADPNLLNNSSVDLATVSSHADLSVTKTSNPKPVRAGQVIYYTIQVTNSGASSATAVALTDEIPAAILGAEFSINAGSTWSPWVSPYNMGTVVANTTVSLLIRGTVNPDIMRVTPLVNTASVSSVTPDPNAANNTATDHSVILVPHPYLSIRKTALESTYSAVGDILHYKINLLNTSTDILYDVVVTDPNATITAGNPIARLAPWESAEVSASHVITQADLNAGKVSNIAYAAGRNASGVFVSDSCDAVVTSALQRPQVTATKFVSETAFKSVGEVIHYTIEIFNCGNVTLTGLNVTDAHATFPQGSQIASLAPRTTKTLYAEHVVTQADVAAGKISNIATARGLDPLGNPVTDESNEVTIYANQPAKLILVKSARENAFKSIGDTIHYDIAVKNFRSTTMTQLIVSDPNAVFTGGNTLNKLESGQTATLKAYHVINQSDLDAGKVVNVATARGMDYYDFLDRATSNEVTVFASQEPMLVITKTTLESSFSAVDDMIHYTNEIRNTGNVIITGITLDDPDTHYDQGNQIAVLNPGQSVSLRTTHVVSQSDLNMGLVEKSATVSGFDPNSNLISFSSNKVTVTGQQQPGLTTTLSAAETSYNTAGDVIHYSVEIRNTGNVTLTGLDVKGTNASLTNGGTVAQMMPGARMILAAEHVVTEADVTSSRLESVVTITGNKPNGGQVTGESNHLTLMAGLVQGLTLTAVAQESAYRRSGELIHYTLTIRNRGNVPVSNISVSDPGARVTGSPVALIPVSGSVTLTAERTVTQSDLDAGQISNRASITGRYPDGSAFNEHGNEVVIQAIAEPAIIASIRAEENSFREAGDQLHFNIEVLNTGNLTLSDINLQGIGELAINGGRVLTLAPGEKSTIPAVYAVSVADLDAGKVIRSVNSAGKDPQGRLLRMTSNEVTIAALQDPKLTASAEALQTTFSQVGEVIRYRIAVKNSGNVSIISMAVTDPNAVIIDVRPVTLLLPGETVVFTASHLVTQTDMDAGMILNTANALGFDLNGNTIETRGNLVKVTGLQNPELSVVNSPSRSSYRSVGEVIQYSIMVRNSGNVSLRSIGISDPALTLAAAEPISTLLPGEAVSVAASHTVTQADLDAGEVVSKAKAAGSDVNGKSVENTGKSVIVTAEQLPSLVVTTATSVPSYKREGDVILYTAVVTNTGNVTMSDIYVTDAKVILDFGRPITLLAPGATASLTAEHRVTMEDIRSGKIVTAGIAHGTILTAQKYSYPGNEVTVRMEIENYNLTNFPNPFRYETTISFDLPERGEVILKVYDLTGREVSDLERREFEEGRNFVKWRTIDTQKGLYILKLYYKGDMAIKMVSIIN